MKITDSASFGQAIRDRRKELGYTQQNFSEMTGLSVSFLSDLERGKRTAELDKAFYVASMLSLNIYLETR